MSQFLGLAQGAELFASFLFGGPPPVVLGGITFSELEVPEKAPWGGKQQLIIHKLPGGKRVIDAMGRDDQDISWSGILEGPLAGQRALQIDQLRVAGLPVQLTWDVFTWTVLVSDFSANYVHRNWIPYELKLVVVVDNSANFNPGPTTLELILQDVATALSVVVTVENAVQIVTSVVAGLQMDSNSTTANITDFQDSLANPDSFQVGSQSWTQAVNDGQTAQTSCSTTVGDADTVLAPVAGGASTTLGILGTNRPSVAITNLSNYTAATATGYGTLQQDGFVSRALANLRNGTNLTTKASVSNTTAQGNSVSQVVQVTGGNCFILAAQYLQDATQFLRIMQQNDLSDYEVPGLKTLVIPNVDPTQTGGEPIQ